MAPDQPIARRPPARSAHHALLFGITRNKRAVGYFFAGMTCVVVAAGALFLYTDLSWAGLIDWIEQLNPLAVLPAMALLPVAGFPIAIVYLIAGARFGPVLGGVVVTAVTAVHLLATYGIARSFLRAPLQRFIARKHFHLPDIPRDEQAAVCLIAALVPGIPYFIRNYLLALAGIRLAPYLWVCLPIYVARSYVTILLGDMGGDPHPGKILFLLGIDGLKVGICAYVIWRLREHHRKYHPHEHVALRDSELMSPPNAAAK